MTVQRPLRRPQQSKLLTAPHRRGDRKAAFFHFIHRIYYFRTMKIKQLPIILSAMLLAAAAAGCHRPEAGTGNLEGRVTYSSGEGIEGVSVIYGDSAIYTTETGAYVFEGLPDGLQGISFRKEGHYSILQQVHIPDGGTEHCDVQMELIMSGWAAGAEDSGYGTILHTSDAGATWVRQGNTMTVPATRLTDVCAVDNMTCWIAGEPDMLRGSTVILHTQDGGETWANQGSSLRDIPPVTIASIMSCDGDTAWAVTADTCLILKTTDAGRNWTLCHSSSSIQKFTGIATMDGYRVWCCGAGYDGSAAIEYTEDGGRTWTSLTVSGTYSRFTPTAVNVSPAPVIYLAGDNSTGIICSADGGATWELAAGAGVSLYCIDIYNGTCVWTGGYGGHLFMTSDAFFTNRDLLPAESQFPDGTITAVAMLRDGLKGALSVQSSSGATGSILYTTDGGSTWSYSSLPFNFSIESLDFSGGYN